MGTNENNQLVYTVKDRCRTCYTCVRECPVKAIKIINGQAEVLMERCIGCGNCVKVCSQGAKMFLNTQDKVQDLLNSEEKVVVCVAPSFPAEFTEINNYTVLVGMLRELGFDKVVEVSFGADLVAKEYKKKFDDPKSEPCIASDCPAIVYFIEHYHSKLVPSLAPIASPMVAMARVVRKKHGKDTKIVFVGPCIAKKAESKEIDVAITFKELRQLFKTNNIQPDQVKPSEFDPPHAGKGAIFPVSRGLLQTVEKSEDICDGNIVVAEGKVNFQDAVSEFENGLIGKQHLELLCCQGCIMGPGMSIQGRKYSKRSNIANYVQEKLQKLDQNEWQEDMEEYQNLDLSQQFEAKERLLDIPENEEIDKVLKQMGKYEPKDMLNCGACGYDTCHEHAVAIIDGLAETEMCLPYTIEKLHKSIDELNLSNEKLETAQQALVQSEKLAHMGQLSAGIAHELNNPLGVITMYSNILKDETRENDPIRKDLELITEQADRCKKIVGGLLNFARKNQVRLVETNIEEFTKTSISSIIKPDNVKIKFNSSLADPWANIDTDQMMQVLTNLEKNAVEAMLEEGGVLSIELEGNLNEVVFKISDTGSGISEENMKKIFTPFFTTKEVGKGTGLGLPLIYGIVKMHNGKIDVKSNADPDKGPTGTTFTIRIPKSI